jgi:hypothetical protein
LPDAARCSLNCLPHVVLYNVTIAGIYRETVKVLVIGVKNHDL